MIGDLPVNVTIDLGTVMLGLIFYGLGLITVMSVRRFFFKPVTSSAETVTPAATTKPDYHADDAIVEAVVLEYTRRLREYDRTIAEMRTRMDIMEVKSQSSQPSQVSSVPIQQQQQQQSAQPHVRYMRENVTVTQPQQHITSTQVDGNIGGSSSGQQQNGTMDYILKLLDERPRTSREVQQAIGRTREHTARLMKKLHEEGLVSREINSKPFRYNITEAGRKMLTKDEQQRSVAHVPEIQ